MTLRRFAAGLGSIALLALTTVQGHANAWPADEIAPVKLIEGGTSGLNYPSGAAIGPDGLVYVANYRSNSVSVYEVNPATQSLRLVRSLLGPLTEIRRPTAVAVDDEGRLYVANTFGITSYNTGWQSGNTRPDRTLAGPNSQIVDPTAIAFDSVGRMYVAATYASRGTPARILVFPADWPSGDIPPVSVLLGAGTGLDAPEGIAFDSQGRMYVANERWISVHAAGWRGGNACPIAILGGGSTQLQRPQGIAFDELGFMLVSNSGGPDSARVTVYPPDWPTQAGSTVYFPCAPFNGARQWTAPPIDSLSGPSTKLDRVSALAVGDQGQLISVSEGAHRVTLHRSTTQLVSPVKLAPADLRLSAAKVSIGADSSSGLAVSLKSETPEVCTGEGRREVQVGLTGVGTCRLTLSQSGSSRWSPAPSLSYTFAVLPSTQEISVRPLPDVPVSRGRIFPKATATSGLPVIWASQTPKVCATTRGFGARVRLLGPGSCRLRVTQPGNDWWLAAPEREVAFAITRG